MKNTPIPVFDGHNDTLLRLDMAWRQGKPISFLDGHESLHIDLPKAQSGKFVGGLFAIFVPPPASDNGALDFTKMAQPLEQPYALDVTNAMISHAINLERQAKGAVRICRSTADIREAMANAAIALVLHIEGAEAIDGDFHALDVLYAAGLRSIGPVWSRNNIFGAGVPFDFPGSPDVGPGLTDKGLELVRRCNRLGVLIDLSHLNEKGFWDVARHSDKPLVATHSNVHALCPSRRNLTDKQLAAIAESCGLVGLNYAIGFLREDGDKKRADTGLEVMVRHIAYLVEKLGEDGVALGSDFDGAAVPDAVGSAAGNPALLAALAKAGFGRELIEKIAWKNWLSMLEKTIG